MARDFAKDFYNSKAWKECRAFVISRAFGLCECCHQTTGKIVHHVEWITAENVGDPSVTLNPDNLMYVCKECHERIHAGTKDNTVIARFGKNGEFLGNVDVSNYSPRID